MMVTPVLWGATLVGDHTQYKFTDEGVAALSTCPHLKQLTLWGTDVSIEALKALKKAKPQLGIQIIYFGQKPDVSL